MHRVLLLLLTLAACRPPAYVPPSLAEPHATAKVRVIYHEHPETTLNELITVNEHEVGMSTRGSLNVAATVAVRLRPEPTRWKFSSAFSHSVTTTQMQSYTYQCGTSTCTGNRTVAVTSTVGDGSCEATSLISARAGASYILQYDFFSVGNCRVACFEQIPTAEGEFKNQPCE